VVADFILFVGVANCCADMPKKILKSDSNYQRYSKCYRGTVFDSHFHMHNAQSAFYKVVQQHNSGVVANSIPHCLRLYTKVELNLPH